MSTQKEAQLKRELESVKEDLEELKTTLNQTVFSNDNKQNYYMNEIEELKQSLVNSDERVRQLIRDKEKANENLDEARKDLAKVRAELRRGEYERPVGGKTYHESCQTRLQKIELMRRQVKEFDHSKATRKIRKLM